MDYADSVLAAVSVILFLMGYRKLPAYIIEEEEQRLSQPLFYTPLRAQGWLTSAGIMLLA